jgi:hypothetical protein
VAGEEKQAILKKLRIEEVGVWPASDSIFVVDGTIVISLGKEVQ